MSCASADSLHDSLITTLCGSTAGDLSGRPGAPVGGRSAIVAERTADQGEAKGKSNDPSPETTVQCGSWHHVVLLNVELVRWDNALRIIQDNHYEHNTNEPAKLRLHGRGETSHPLTDLIQARSV